MLAAEALTVMPRSRSTVNVSRSVISSLASLVVAVVLLFLLVLLLVLFCIAWDDEDNVAVSIGSWASLSVLGVFNCFAVNCRSRPIFPVYSSIRDARLDLP